MVLYVLLMIFHLLLMGCWISGTFAERSSQINRAPIYRDKVFLQFVNLLFFPDIVIFIILLWWNWKITLVLSILFLLFAKWTIWPLSEILIIFPLYKLLKRNTKPRINGKILIGYCINFEDKTLICFECYEKFPEITEGPVLEGMLEENKVYKCIKCQKEFAK